MPPQGLLDRHPRAPAPARRDAQTFLSRHHAPLSCKTFLIHGKRAAKNIDNVRSHRVLIKSVAYAIEQPTRFT
jgi:hypothetical protein